VRADDALDCCTHMRAIQVGATEAKQLRDGRWLYRTVYQCPDCSTRFSEQHVQTLLRHAGQRVS
jgi:hypothetical protein